MTKSIYEIIPADVQTLTPERIKRTDADGKIWWIPIDPANSDYQAYLNPQAALSTPIVSSDE